MNIGLNAHLLSHEAGYRSAGIHGYIYKTLAALPSVVPADVQLTAMVGGSNPVTIPGVQIERASFDTSAPWRRILWEQAVQPFQLNRFDLYHAGAFISPILPYRPPTVVTVYDLSFVHYPGVLSTGRRAYLRTFTQWSVRRAARVIAISESTARDVADVMGVPPDRIDVAVPGVDSDRFHPLPADAIATFRAQHNLPENFWLFLGTLEPRKNLPTLIDAYARLPRDARPTLVLGGGLGWDYDLIFDAIKRHGLQNEILLPGFIPAQDLPLWYNSADLFLYPSVYEGFGIPPLEAMACGTAVIVSDASSLPEVVRGTAALTVPPLDTDGWEAALRRALDDADWRHAAGETGQTGAARFTWTATAQATWACYQQAIG